MENVSIMIVDNDPDILSMLQMVFTRNRYKVILASRGEEAIENAIRTPPALILMESALPDMDGYEVYKKLKENFRTKFIPVLFLSQRNDRKNRLFGLELGAEDYISKPFDIEELLLRVQNILKRRERENDMDAQSHLPSIRMIEAYLREIINQEGWCFLDMHIRGFQPFKEKYGFLVASDVFRYTAMLMREISHQLGTPKDFLGHAGSEDFVFITAEDNVQSILTTLKTRFDHEVLTYYDFLDREQGYVHLSENGSDVHYPLMSLSIGSASPSQYRFSDIREIIEVAALEHKKPRTDL